jgi:Thiamine pyrophosphate-requiring enzymes [acetolactate synthase, pyruvate dehydrogenase (cytochrome), glyoxylate carboligase, phosphonopyruvate decarboxylase]
MTKANLPNGAEIIVDYLIEQKVPYMVGVCGHANIGLMNAAADRQDRFGTISVHNEQTAGFMADAYFRVTGQPLATYTSVGPGSIAIQVAIANALFDGSAILAITGNIPTQQFNRMPFQELGHHYQADFPSAMRPYVKRSFQATRTDMLPHMVRHAYNAMMAGRKGPVHLDVPMNVFDEVTEETVDYFPKNWRDNIHQDCAADPQALAQCVEMLLLAERPVIVAGNGALGQTVEKELLALARMLNIPVASTAQAKGVIDENDPLCLGPLGRDGVYPSNRATRGCDVILAIGTRFGDRSSSSWRHGVTHAIPPQKLIHVDIDPGQFGRNYPPALAIVASARTFIQQLIEAFSARQADVQRSITARASWTERWQKWKRQWDQDVYAGANRGDQPIHPDRLVNEMAKALPANAIVAADIGMNHTWLVQQWRVRSGGQLIQSGGLAAMGMGVCGALGAKLAATDRVVVSFSGDGGFMMHSNAVATGVEYDLPVIWVVMNNGGYISIRDLQRGRYGKEYATRFVNVKTGEIQSADLALMARALGANGIRVDHPDELGGAFEAAIDSGRPTVIDVRTQPDVQRLTAGVLDFPPILGAPPSYNPDPLD